VRLVARCDLRKLFLALLVCLPLEAGNNYGKLPLSFEPNQGQTDARVKFVARASGYTLFMTADEAVFASRDGSVERMKLIGANPKLRFEPLDKQLGISNYFLGNDPSKWRTNVPNYGRVAMRGIFPGIDLIFYGNERQLEYDWVVAPGADPKLIRVEWEGPSQVTKNASGDLVVNASLVQLKPVILQEGKRIEGGYTVHGRQVALELSKYDRAKPLVIDPVVLDYSTYLGGHGGDHASAVAVDSSGNAYVTGTTLSVDFPTTNPLQRNLAACDLSHQSGLYCDAFVTLLNASGTALIYSTFLGGDGGDRGLGIAVDSGGNAYITGSTNSRNFPTKNAFQSIYPDGGQFFPVDKAFVTKLTPSGSALTYSTYLGGRGGPYGDRGDSVRADANGNAYVAGLTSSTDFPTLKAWKNALADPGGDGFVAKLDATGSLIYSTYLGSVGAYSGATSVGCGCTLFEAVALTVDVGGNAYVTGSPRQLPAEKLLQPEIFFVAIQKAFVIKFDPTGIPVFSRYLGDGSGHTSGAAIAVDASGAIYVAGSTDSNDFPTKGPAQSTKAGFADDLASGGTGFVDGFVAKLDPTGASLIYSTYLGGDGTDAVRAMTVDPSGSVYVAGTANATNFPVANALQDVPKGVWTPFVAKLSPAGSKLAFSTYLGGSGVIDSAYGIAVDSSGNAYVAGETQSNDFPTVNPFQATNYSYGGYSAFVTKLHLEVADEGDSRASLSAGSPGNADVRSIVLDPTNTDVIYAATNGTGVYKSADGGQTWAAANTGLPNPRIRSLSINPKNPSTLYAAAAWKHLQIAEDFSSTDPSRAGGVFKSLDGGNTWSLSSSGFKDLIAVARPIVVDPKDPSRVFVGYTGTPLSDGLIISTDSGQTWKDVGTGVPSFPAVGALAIDPANPTTIYAGLDHYYRNSFPGGVAKSTDAGQTWQITGLKGIGVQALGIDPINPSIVYAGAFGGFMNRGGIFKSTDAGNNWNLVGLSEIVIRHIAINPQNTGTVYASTDEGIFKSVDSGQNWVAVNAGLPATPIWMVAIDNTKPGTLYAATHGGGVFKSADGGLNWYNSATPGCTYALSLGGQAFPAQGGTGTIIINTSPNCPWTVGNLPPWVTLTSVSFGTGNGIVTFQLTPNSGGDLSSSFKIAGQSFSIEQQASAIPGLTLIGSMPHIAAEENWLSAFTLVNKSAAPATARLSLFGDAADPSGDGLLMLPLVFPQQAFAPGPLLAASFDRNLAANASLIVNTSGPQTLPVLVGSAQLAGTGAVDGFAVFHQIPTAQEAVVPIETRNASSYLLAFDNTNGLVLGVAVENVSAQSAVIGVVIRDDGGNVISAPGASISVPGNGHFSFVLSDPAVGFPVTANIRGTIEFDTPSGGRISVLGLRFTPPNNSLTTIPALANVGTAGGSIAHLASGGDGWQTTFVLINTGTSSAQATLSFFADQTGAPMLLPLTFPQGIIADTTAPFVAQALPAGATLVIASSGAPNLLTGSAQVSTNGHVSGFVIFRHNGQEAVVPLESRNANSYIIAFDNTNGTATGIALNTVSAGQFKVPVIVRDDTGAQIATDIIAMPPNGHYAFTLGTDRYPATATIRGTIEFVKPANAQIGALGIRIPAGAAHTYTTLPALAK